MKKLTLLRHAKSSWNYSVSDRDRPLTENGIKAMIKLVRLSKKIFETAQIVISSPANRAIHSAIIMMHTAKISYDKLRVSESLYTFNGNEVIDFIKENDDSFNDVIIIGHNPAFTVAANYFSYGKNHQMSTSSWIQINFKNKKWNSIEKGISVFGSRKINNII